MSTCTGNKLQPKSSLARVGDTAVIAVQVLHSKTLLKLYEFRAAEAIRMEVLQQSHFLVFQFYENRLFLEKKTHFLKFRFLTHLTDAYETDPGPSSGAEIKSPRVF